MRRVNEETDDSLQSFERFDSCANDMNVQSLHRTHTRVLRIGAGLKHRVEDEGILGVGGSIAGERRDFSMDVAEALEGHSMVVVNKRRSTTMAVEVRALFLTTFALAGFVVYVHTIR